MTEGLEKTSLKRRHLNRDPNETEEPASGRSRGVLERSRDRAMFVVFKDWTGGQHILFQGESGGGPEMR